MPKRKYSSITEKKHLVNILVMFPFEVGPLPQFHKENQTGPWSKFVFCHWADTVTSFTSVFVSVSRNRLCLVWIESFLQLCLLFCQSRVMLTLFETVLGALLRQIRFVFPKWYWPISLWHTTRHKRTQRHLVSQNSTSGFDGSGTISFCRTSHK